MRAAGDRGETTDSSHARAVPSARDVYRDQLGAALTAILGVFIFFFHLGAYGLWEPDEARYAEIAREMLVLRDLIVPQLDFVPYIEKPPLLYWLTALSMQLFGVNEFAARFVNAAAALAGLLAIYSFALRAYDRRHALCAAIILATSALYALMAQVLTTDMLLTTTVTVALFAFFLHWRDGGRWCWFAYVAMGLAVLTKGPIGIAIPVATVTLFLTLERDWRGALRRFHVVTGFALTTAIVAPWFIAIALRQPDFVRFYFIGEHLQRFFEAGYSHGQPFYYYGPVLIGGAMPWSLVAFFVPWRSLQPDPARRFCLIATATIVFIFSAANAKLIPYILPAMPPVAVLLADGILTLAIRSRRLAVCGPLLSLVGLGIIAAAAFADRFASANPAMVQPELYAAGAIMLATGLAIFAFFSRQQFVAGMLAIAIGSIAVLTVASYGRLRMESARSYAALARAIAVRAPDAQLICYPRYIQSLPFYTRRRVILIGPRTELDYGSSHAPDAPAFFFSRSADLLRLWSSNPPPLLIIDRWALPPLLNRLGRYQVIASDTKKLAIMRAPSSASVAR